MIQAGFRVFSLRISAPAGILAGFSGFRQGPTKV